MPHNPKINDFVATVEAVNDSELLPSEMHDAYANGSGFMDDFDLARLEYFAGRIKETIDLARNTRNDY
jgi:hypothetical protein